MATTIAHTRTMISAQTKTWTLIQNPLRRLIQVSLSNSRSPAKNAFCTPASLVNTNHTRKAMM